MTLILPQRGRIRQAAAGGSTTQTSQLVKPSTNAVIDDNGATNNRVTTNSNFGYGNALGDNPKSSGKWYCEFICVWVEGDGNYLRFGLVNDGDVASALGATFFNADPPGSTMGAWRSTTAVNSAGTLLVQANDSTNGWNAVTGTITPLSFQAKPETRRSALAVDIDNGLVWVGQEDSGAITWVNSGNPASGTNETATMNEAMSIAPACSVRRATAGGNFMTLCTGSNTCSYSPPSGFDYWDAT